MELKKSSSDCNRLSFQDWIALVTVCVLVLTAIAGFVSHLVAGTENKVLQAIDSVETKIETIDRKIEKVDGKVDKHIDFHLTNKLQCRSAEVKENAEEEDTKKESTGKGNEIAWRGERRTEEGKKIRN